MFLNNNNTICIDSIAAITNHYNKSLHEALNGTSPDDATKKAHESMILDINIVRNRMTNMVNDLNIGDHVRRNRISTEKNNKGADPKWSGKVSKVIKINGRTITLNNNSKYK